MTTNSDLGGDEQRGIEGKPSDTLFDRRNYLKLASASAFLGLGTTALGRPAAADSTPKRTLTIEGNSGTTTYRVAVEGNLKENYGLNDHDEIDGTIATGAVTTGQNSYTFSGDIAEFDFETDGSFTTFLNGSEVEPEVLGQTQTAPDADQLPNEVSITGIANRRVDYGVGVTGQLATGDRANTWNGDNAAYDYAFAGDVIALTDFDSIQIDVNREKGHIVVTNTGDYQPTGYRIEVSGSLETYEGNPDSVSGGTATGTVDKNTHVFGFSGDVQKLVIENAVRVEVTNAYPLITFGVVIAAVVFILINFVNLSVAGAVGAAAAGTGAAILV